MLNYLKTSIFFWFFFFLIHKNIYIYITYRFELVIFNICFHMHITKLKSIEKNHPKYFTLILSVTTPVHD